MSDSKEAASVQVRGGYDEGRTAERHLGSSRLSQKLDVRLVHDEFQYRNNTDLQPKEVPLVETSRRFWINCLILVDWHQFNHQLSFLEWWPDDSHLGNDTGWHRNSCDCGVARRVSFDV